MSRLSTKAAALLAVSLLAAACAGPAAGGGGTETLRLGHFPNITHATAIVGVEEGIFERHLGPLPLDVRTFSAGPEAVEAIFSGGLDAAYVGPNPAINAFTRSDGRAIRVVAGATSGGAFLVVKPGINAAADLRGRTLATPQIGNTQDVALRSWLARNGLETTREGGGDVAISPAPGAQIFETFRAGGIDGGWVPEPWATRMILQAGGEVLVDERDLWPDGRYVTTHLIVRTEFLEQHPDVVRRLLRAHLDADELIHSNPALAKQIVNRSLERITGQGLPENVLEAAWENLEFTVDPVASSLKRSAAEAMKFGFLDDADLRGIHDLSELNRLLRAAGRDEVEGL